MSGPVFRNHTLLNMATMAGISNATLKTMYRSLSQDYRPVLPFRLQVHLLHRYRRIQLKTLRQVQQQVAAVHHWKQLRNSIETKIKNIINHTRDLPEWWEDFTENQENEGVLASRDTPASTSRGSDSERPTKVVSRKHSRFTYFPKDRNCHVCKRTKMTRAPCRKVPRAEDFGDLITADHKSSQ